MFTFSLTRRLPSSFIFTYHFSLNINGTKVRKILNNNLLSIKKVNHFQDTFAYSVIKILINRLELYKVPDNIFDKVNRIVHKDNENVNYDPINYSHVFLLCSNLLNLEINDQ